MTTAVAAGANIAALLQRATAGRGPAAAIVANDGRVIWTFDELVEEAALFAGGLADLGVGEGDRVLILEPDRRRLYPILVGVIWAGATAMFPPLSQRLPEALRIAAGHRPRVVIASLALWPAALSVAGLRAAPIRVTSGPLPLPGMPSTRSLARHATSSPRAVPPSAPAIVSFTTGITGPARPIARSHGVLAAQHEAMSAMRALDESDRDFAGLPVLVLHDLGLGVTCAPAPRGASSATYGRQVREAIDRTGATSVAAFPHLFESAIRGARPGELGALRSIFVGGSRVRAELLRKLRTVAPGAQVTVVYGSTEVEPIAAIDAGEYLARLDNRDDAVGVCVGAVLDGLELRVDAAGGSIAAATGGTAIGRILVRGSRAAAQPGTDGWVDTGDLGRLDEDGRLWLHGRASSAVGDTSPFVVEGIVEDLPWVARAAFVGVDSMAAPIGRLAVQPHAWPAAARRTAWQREIEALAAERRWPLQDVLLVRRLPVVAGAAAKIDENRLRRLRTS